MSKPRKGSLILTEVFQQVKPTRRQEEIQRILDVYLRQQLQR